MKDLLLVLLLFLLSRWYLSHSATRLDRLHHRVETGWANLDGLLQRRAAVALEIARSTISDPATSLILTAAAHQAREANVQDRSMAESGLSGALGLLLHDEISSTAFIEKDLMRELSELTDKIRVAIEQKLQLPLPRRPLTLRPRRVLMLCLRRTITWTTTSP